MCLVGRLSGTRKTDLWEGARGALARTNTHVWRANSIEKTTHPTVCGPLGVWENHMGVCGWIGRACWRMFQTGSQQGMAW